MTNNKEGNVIQKLIRFYESYPRPVTIYLVIATGCLIFVFSSMLLVLSIVFVFQYTTNWLIIALGNFFYLIPPISTGLFWGRYLRFTKHISGDVKQ